MAVASGEVSACVLCGGRSAWVGVHVPDDPQRARRSPLRPGLVRAAVYGLCSGCSALPDFGERVEAEVEARAVAEAN
jgi:hypothetical protein